MKKQLLFWSMLIGIFTIGNAMDITFPDANFKQALLNDPSINTTDDGEITEAEAEAVTYLNVSNQGIRDLTGIEYFVNLEDFNASNNFLKSVDFFYNPLLKSILIRKNELNEVKLINNINLTSLDLAFNEINKIEISSNINLKTLILSKNHLSTIDLSENINLTILSLSSNPITEIDLLKNEELKELDLKSDLITEVDLSKNILLDFLDLGGNSLTNIDLSENINLTFLYIGFTSIISVNVSKNTKLKQLFLGYNKINSINLSTNSSLKQLGLNHNQLSKIDLSNQNDLTYLSVGSNNLTTLDVTHCVLTEINFSGNPNLQEVFMTGQPLEYKTILGEDVLEVGLIGCPNLQFICANQEYLNDIYSLLEDANQTSCLLSSDCDDPHNRIEGQLVYDVDNDGCGNADDVPFNEVLKFTASSSTGGDPIYAYTNDEGEYAFHVSDDTYTFLPELENTTYFTLNPAIVFPLEETLIPDNIDTLTTDYCIQPLGIFNDLEVVIFPLSVARPGFDATYLIRYKNIGTTTQSGTVTLDYQDDVLEYVSSTPSVTSDTNGQLTWSFNNLSPMETVEIPLTLVLNKPTDSPPLNGGEILNFVATITAGADETPENNVMELAQPVVNSYDPNDKTCLEGDILDPDDVGNYLHYMIRFENEGTAEAVNIRVLDVIDTAKLDITSFVPLKSSHSYSTTITNENEVEFTFRDINLPFDDSNNDGFVLFKIKTLDTLVLGDEIVNSAAIYFDYNFPILTENSVVKVEEKEEDCEVIDFTSFYFERALENYLPAIDSNGDGEISTCEAEAVTSLSFTEENITDIDDISYFTNLISFSSYGNALNDVNFTNNIKLKSIVISSAYFIGTSQYYGKRTDAVDISNNDALESLVLIENSIREIDLSNKTKLTNIQVSGNQLTSIDVSDCASLVTLDVSGNNYHLDAIDVSNNSLLKELNIAETDIEILNIENNVALTNLNIAKTEIDILDVTNHLALTNLNISETTIDVLDIENNVALTELNVADTRIEYLDCSKSPYLKILDVSDCLYLAELDASVNSLSNLNVDSCSNLETLYMKGAHEFYNVENFENFQLASNNDLVLICMDPIANLEEFEDYVKTESTAFRNNGSLNTDSDCRNCEIIDFANSKFKQVLLNYSPSIDTNGNGEINTCEAEAVTTLSFTEEGLTNIEDISYFTNLTSFSSYDNALDDVNFNNNIKLENVVISASASYRATDAVDLSNNAALENLVLTGNYYLREIDLSNNVNLVSIQLSENNLRSIDVSACTSLVTLEIKEDDYYFDAVDVSNNTLLKDLNISETNIETLDLSNNPLLKELNISETYINELDLSNNVVLTDLNISETNIEVLDLTNNIALTDLNISETDIEVLDATNNVALTDLNISETVIEILDLHNNVALTDLNISETDIEVLDCSNNPNLKNLDVSECDYLVKLDASVNALKSINIADCRSLETIYMKGAHEFYNEENFENFQLGDTYDLNDIRLICIDPITNFDEFEAYLNNESYYFESYGNLNSSTENCNPTSSNEFSDYFTVYPNPASYYFRITATNSDDSIRDNQIYHLTITDFYGRTIDFIDYSSYEDFYYFRDYISLSSYNLVPGIYYLTLSTEIGVFTSSLVIN